MNPRVGRNPEKFSVISLQQKLKERDHLIFKMNEALKTASRFMSDVGAPDYVHEEVDEAIALADAL
jgi:hypothetical protein